MFVKSKAGFKIGVLTILIIGVFYLLIFGSTYLQFVDGEKLKFTRLLVTSIFSDASAGNCQLRSIPVLIANLLKISQLFFHMPFMYYIGKEHFLVCVDEILNQSMSQMIDRKLDRTGDPRFFLFQRDRKKYVNIDNQY